eukprot:9601970-Alexandrium_andersonii.AAC.1
MSASLVGSEMCIRDRCASPPGHQRRRHPELTWARRRGHERGRPGPARPVSYTHLTLPTICSV